MADNLNRRFDYLEDTDNDKQIRPTAQEYQNLDGNSMKLRDMIFFGRLSAFCISTVLVAFLFLVAQVATFWSFFWAIVISIVLQLGVQYLIYRLKNKREA